MSQLASDWLMVSGLFAGQLLLKAVLWALVFGFAGLLLALRVMWLLHKRRLLRREHGVWNLAAKASHLIVLVALVAAGGACGVLYSAQGELNRAVTEYAQPALAAHMPALRAQLAERVGPMASDGAVTARDLVQPFVQDFLYQPKSDGMIERTRAWLINGLVTRVGARALTLAVQQGLGMLPEFLLVSSEVKEQLAEFSVDALKKVLAGAGEKLNSSPLDHSVPEIFADTLHMQIDSLFKSLYLGILLKLLLAAALIGAEMLIYFRYYLPRAALPAPEASLSACQTGSRLGQTRAPGSPSHT